jgi:hypothetical protein
VLPNDYRLFEKGTQFDLEPIAQLSPQGLPTVTAPTVLRPLGSFEEFLWLIHQNRPVHFALALRFKDPQRLGAGAARSM